MPTSPAASIQADCHTCLHSTCLSTESALLLDHPLVPGEHLLPAFADVASLVGRGLADPQEGVRSAALHALLALGVLASTLGTEKEVVVFQGLVGMLLQVRGPSAAQAAANRDRAAWGRMAVLQV